MPVRPGEDDGAMASLGLRGLVEVNSKDLGELVLFRLLRHSKGVRFARASYEELKRSSHE